MPQTDIRPRQIHRFAIRLVVFAALLLAVAHLFESRLVTPLLPVFGWTLEHADPRFRVDDIQIERQKTGSVIQFKVSPVRVLVFGDLVVTPAAGRFMTPSTLVGSALQPVILLLAIVMAWPATSLGALAVRLAVSLPAVVVLIVLNVPLAIAGHMLDVREYLPGGPVAPLVYWNDFLQTGGALVLAIGSAALVLAADRAVRCRR